MTWSPETSRGNEAAKIRFEIVPYTRGAVLDIGCGPYRPFKHFIGIDQQAGATLCMDGRQLPIFASGIFDAVFSSHFLEHVEDYEATLAEWWRVIREGGYLVLYLPHADLYPRIGQPGANPDHKHDLFPVDITAAMQELGDCVCLRDEVRGEGDEYSFFQVYQKRAGENHCEATWVDPRPRAGIVRPGAYGDSLWASSVAAHLHDAGFHVTVYTERAGDEVLRADPNIDTIIVTDSAQLDLKELAAYWDYEAPKYAKWVNLAESIEKNLLAVSTDLRFYWPDKVRRDIFGGSYFDRIHDLADVPRELRMRFYPTEAEATWAQLRVNEIRAAGDKVAVLCASGSTPPKFYPFMAELLTSLALRAYHITVLGDLRDWEPALPGSLAKRLAVIGEEWPMRDALAFARQADLVIGQETAILNAVAMEPMRKVVLLTHSTVQNLTDQWVNTRSLFGSVACYPCHRLHQTFKHCPRDVANGAAVCQAAIPVMAVVDAAVAPDETPTMKAA